MYTNKIKTETSTHLELQHVTLVVTDVNAECVDVWRPWANIAPVLVVPRDVKGHS